MISQYATADFNMAMIHNFLPSPSGLTHCSFNFLHRLHESFSRWHCKNG